VSRIREACLDQALLVVTDERAARRGPARTPSRRPDRDAAHVGDCYGYVLVATGRAGGSRSTRR
jgi:hypothetical protein